MTILRAIVGVVGLAVGVALAAAVAAAFGAKTLLKP